MATRTDVTLPGASPALPAASALAPPEPCVRGGGAQTPEGYVSGFTFDQAGNARALTWQEVLLPCPAGAEDAPVWLHLNGSDARIIEWLDRHEGLPEAAREFLTGNGHAAPITYCGQLSVWHRGRRRARARARPDR